MRSFFSKIRSICSIGIVRVDGDEAPKRLHNLVNPCDEFDAANIAIHGIRPGTYLRATGRFCRAERTARIYNPAYDIVPTAS